MNSARQRPLSPHLSIWRWHPTMATSILHRATGVGLYAGMAMMAGWFIALAMGESAYSTYTSWFEGWFGLIIKLGFCYAMTYHILNGLRYLAWDLGHGFAPRTANMTAWFVLLLPAFVAAYAAIYWI